MKKIFVLAVTAFIFLSTQSAEAQTRVSPQMAQSYAQNCSQQENPYISSETKDIFCQCTASYMQKTMSVEDLQAMGGNDQPARNAINKMMIQVYSPCMEFPVRDLVYKKCQEDAFQAGQKICKCLSNNMASYVSKRAKADLPGILQANPNVTDPMEAIVTSPSYEQTEKRIALGCIQGEYQ
ncbi:MAG: hypothetical protein CL565_00205 [Alphaproteobacteria bacterium]|nr:hypothetical protein [Alphaproteobacteria bacterium]